MQAAKLEKSKQVIASESDGKKKVCCLVFMFLHVR
jgi:hypothetical protein